MKKLLKYLLYIFLFSLGGVALYFLIAFILMAIPASSDEVAEEKNLEFFVQSNGTHLDIILPLEHMESAFRDSLHLPEGTKYVALGWGNKEFYFNVPEWKDLTAGLAFRAMFFRLEAAMHVSAYSLTKENWTRVAVAKSQIAALCSFVEASFVKSKKSFLLCKEPVSNDWFYDAHGKYSCINTCNTWVNDALKAASVKTALWSPLHWGVLYHLD